MEGWKVVGRGGASCLTNARCQLVNAEGMLGQEKSVRQRHRSKDWVKQDSSVDAKSKKRMETGYSHCVTLSPTDCLLVVREKE